MVVSDDLLVVFRIPAKVQGAVHIQLDPAQPLPYLVHTKPWPT
jgi:hypothetical protein